MSSQRHRRSFLRACFRDPSLVLGGVLLAAVLLSSTLGQFFISADPLAINLWDRLQSPNGVHLLGTDEMGRDVLARVLAGGRISLMSAGTAMLISACIGIALGLITGLFGGWIDLVVMRLVDLLLAFPTLLLAIIVVATLGASLQNAIIAIAIARLPLFARVTRISTMQTKELLYVEGARAIGTSIGRIMISHILRNILSPLIVATTLQLGHTIILLSTLGFLGLGAQPPSPEWGLMLSRSREYLYIAPYLAFPPGLMIACSVLGLNLIGDGIRDMLDPHQRRRR